MSGIDSTNPAAGDIELPSLERYLAEQIVGFGGPIRAELFPVGAAAN
jgi:hypothetical protein